MAEAAPLHRLDPPAVLTGANLMMSLRKSLRFAPRVLVFSRAMISSFQATMTGRDALEFCLRSAPPVYTQRFTKYHED